MALAIQSASGLIAFSLLAWVVGEGRSRDRLWPALRIAAAGIALQLAIAVAILGVPPIRAAFQAVNDAVVALQAATQAGTSFVFGYLGGGPLPFAETHAGASFVLAFQALPLILVVSALTALLVYWRILPLLVRGFALVLERAMGVGGAVGLAAAANIFVGMVEAPLFVRPYLARLTRSELFTVMTCGMATIAGTVFALYAIFLAPVVPDAAAQLLVASIISAPAAIMVARLMVPETGESTAGSFIPHPEADGAMDAIARGTVSGLQIYLNVVAMLLVLVALVHLVNAALGLLPEVAEAPLSLQRALGWVMAPVCWLMGIPWAEAATAGALMGTKTVLNELLAYLELAGLPEDALSPRSRLIMVYALCGFANFSSLGIMIGGMAALVPERRAEIAGLGMKSLVGGTLATCLTGSVVGIVG